MLNRLEFYSLAQKPKLASSSRKVTEIEVKVTMGIEIK